MIKEKQSVSLSEAKEIVDTLKETEKLKEFKGFVKKFNRLDPKKAKALRKDLEALDIIKLKQEDFSKIIEIIPEDTTDINKIIVETNLDADETNKILDTVKKYK